MIKLRNAILLLVVVIAAAFFYMAHTDFKEKPIHKDIKIDGAYSEKAARLEPFKLMDHHGNSFTNENLKGHWTLMAFGFTNCNYVCPTTLTELKRMYALLSQTMSANQLPQVVLVTVDPARDTRQVMNDYINHYNSKFLGVLGDEKELTAFEKQLHIVAQKVPDEDDPDEYVVKHSAEILVFNPQGELQAYLAYPHTAKRLVSDYQAIVSHSN